MRSNTMRIAASKVPEVTIYFWIIKILATTVAETAADYVNMTLGYALRTTTVIAGILLVVVLVAQFATNRYVPAVYWLAVVVISVAGTLITDNLTDVYGVPLTVSTMVFAAILACVFSVWYLVERTLSIHSIRTRRREAFYWLAVLATFALGTAAGDLLSEQVNIGYGWAAAVFAAIIAVIAAAYWLVRRSGVTWVSSAGVVAFWLVYIATRPLGASLGDLLTQPTAASGWGLGTTGPNWVFAIAIVVLVGYLSITKVDRIPAAEKA